MNPAVNRPRPDTPGPAGGRVALETPRVLNVEMTNECNLERPMCARTTEMTRPVQHMSKAVFQRIIDEADELRVRKLWLHMFGESLLHPQIYDFIEYAARKTRIGLVALSTNVTTLNERNARRLIESGLGHLILSVDAQSDDIYKIVRGFDFARVRANTRRFLELHREYESTMSVNVSIIAMGIKAAEIGDFRREWAPFESGRVKVLVKTLTNFGGLVDTGQFAGGEPDSLDAARTDGRRKTCPQLWDSLTVQSNGDIVACCYDINGSMGYGNVNDLSLRDAWDGTPIRQLRDQHVTLDFSQLPLCGACEKTFRKPKPTRAPVPPRHSVPVVAVARTRRG